VELFRLFFVLVLMSVVTQCVGSKKAANKRKKGVSAKEVAAEAAAQMEQLSGNVSLPLLQSFAAETDEITAIGSQSNGALVVAVGHETPNNKFQSSLEFVQPLNISEVNVVRKDILDGKVEAIFGLADGSWILVGSFIFYGSNEVGGILKMDAAGEFDEKFFGVSCGGFNGPVSGMRSQSSGNILLFGDFTKYCEYDADHMAVLNSSGEFVRGFVNDGATLADIPRSTTTIFDTESGADPELDTSNAVAAGGEQVNETQETNLPESADGTPTTSTTMASPSGTSPTSVADNETNVAFEEPQLPVVDSHPTEQAPSGGSSSSESGGSNGGETTASESVESTTTTSSSPVVASSTTISGEPTSTTSAASDPSGETTNVTVVTTSTSASTTTTVPETLPEDAGASDSIEQKIIDEIVATRTRLRIATENHDKAAMQTAKEELKTLRSQLSDLKVRGSKK
jgi:hypothetical protein